MNSHWRYAVVAIVAVALGGEELESIMPDKKEPKKEPKKVESKEELPDSVDTILMRGGTPSNELLRRSRMRDETRRRKKSK